MMKKKIVIGLSIVLSMALLCVIGVSAADKLFSKEQSFFEALKSKKSENDIVATVNGKDIYSNQIEIALTFQELSKENAKEYGASDAVVVQTREEILNDLIEDEVVLQKAKQLKLEADYDAAEKYIKDSFDLIKQKNDENTEFINKYIKELNLTEEQYLKQATAAYRNQLTRAALYDWYSENHKDEKDIKEAYTKYTKELVKDANVKIK